MSSEQLRRGNVRNLPAPDVPELAKVDEVRTVDLIPASQRPAYAQAMTFLTASGHLTTDEAWNGYATALSLIPKDERLLYAAHLLPVLLGSGNLKSSGDWKAYCDELRKTPDGQRTAFSRSYLAKKPAKGLG